MVSRASSAPADHGAHQQPALEALVGGPHVRPVPRLTRVSFFVITASCAVVLWFSDVTRPQVLWPVLLLQTFTVSTGFINDARRGHFDVLFTGGAPTTMPKALGVDESVDEAKWRHAWELKVFGYVNLTRELFARMKARRSGVIVNVIGMAGEHPSFEYVCGSMANAGLGAFTKAMGKGSAAFGVRVLGVDGSGSLYDILQGVRFAAGLSNDAGVAPPRRADVINLSLSTTKLDHAAVLREHFVRDWGPIYVAHRHLVLAGTAVPPGPRPLVGRDPRDEVGAVIAVAEPVEPSLRPGKALHDQARLGIHEDGHQAKTGASDGNDVLVVGRVHTVHMDALTRQARIRFCSLPEVIEGLALDGIQKRLIGERFVDIGGWGFFIGCFLTVASQGKGCRRHYNYT